MFLHTPGRLRILSVPLISLTRVDESADLVIRTLPGNLAVFYCSSVGTLFLQLYRANVQVMLHNVGMSSQSRRELSVVLLAVPY